MQVFRLIRRVAPLAPFLLATAACRPGPSGLPAPTLAADSARASTVAAGVTHRTYWIGAGPWVVNALDVDRRACWSPAPLDAEPAGPSRELLTTMASRARARGGGAWMAGAVNADFFLFAPDGLPTGAQVHGGFVTYGPSGRDVLAVDSAMRMHVTRLRVDGWVVAGGDSLRVTRWNRPDSTAVGIFDRMSYGDRVDSARAALAIPLHLARMGSSRDEPQVDLWLDQLLASRRPLRFVSRREDVVDPAAPAIPADGVLLVVGRGTTDSVRALAARIAVAARDSARLRIAIRPFHPRQAIGGNGVLLRDGQVPASLDSVGNEGFRGRHPSTAVGFDRAGRRLLLVTVDGRQPGYSAGMTLRELAELMRALGADEALNLDGGGSTTFVVPDLQTADGVTIANRPSDKTERKVANGLAVVRECRR